MLVVLLCSITAWGQNTDDFNPASPAEPGEPNLPVIPKDTATYYVLSLLAEEGGSVKSGGGTYTAGTAVQVVANAASTNFVFTGWTDEKGDTIATTLSFEYTMPARNVALLAHYDFLPGSPAEPSKPDIQEQEPVEPVTYYTLALAAEEGGSITAGAGQYVAGTEVTVTASAPAANFVFAGWTDSRGDAVSTERSFTYTMPQHDELLTAHYDFSPGSPAEPSEPDIKEPEPDLEPIPAHLLNVSVEEGGTVTVNGAVVNGSATFELAEGATATIATTLSTNFSFNGWYNDGELCSDQKDFTFTMDTVDVSLVARIDFTPGAPSEPSMPTTVNNELYLMSVVGLPGETINYPLYLNSNDTLRDIKFEMQFPVKMVPDFDNVAISTDAVGYTFSYKKYDLNEILGAMRRAPGDSEGVISGDYVIYDITMTGGVIPPGNTPLFIVPVTIDKDIEQERFRVWLSQVQVMQNDSTVTTASTRNGAINTAYEEPDSYSYLDNLIGVGNSTWEVTQERQLSPSEPVSTTCDIQTITQALGCSGASFVTFKGLANRDMVTDSLTAGNGYWFDRNGYVCDATNSDRVVSVAFDENSSKLTLTQVPNTLRGDEVISTKVYFTYKYKYYEMAIKLKVTDIIVNSHDIKYYVNDELYHTETVEEGAKIPIIADPSLTGYTFTGWSGIPADSIMPSSDITVNAVFSVNNYKVTFVSDGVAVKEENLDFGSVITVPENPTKVGYTFTGWSPAVDASVPSHDVTYTAQFSVNQYTITFDTDGGTMIAPITLDYNTAVVAPAGPTKTGYTFAGWDKEIPPTMPAENITVKALWTINSYKLTYMVDGEIYKLYNIEHNAAITPEAAPVKEGHTFSGWSEIPETMPANDVEVTGTFTVNKYKVTFVSEGVNIKEESFDFGSVITAPENPSKVGYTFTGWSPAVDATVPSHDVTYTAQFTINNYTFTFNSNGGSEVAPLTTAYGAEIVRPTDPVREGYTFTGWTPELPAQMPAQDMNFTAQWKINEYTITYMADGTVLQKDVLEYGAAITAPTATKTGYTFTGWDMTIPETMPAHDITVNAVFSVNSYTFTFDSNGGSEVAPITAAYGSDIVRPTDPVREGYAFIGWMPELPAVMPAQDMNFTAQWELHTFATGNLKYNVTSKTELTAEVTGVVDNSVESIIIPANIEKDGVTYSITSMTDDAFADCYNLLEATFETVAIIPAGAFGDAEKPRNFFVFAPAGSTSEYVGNVVIGGIADNVVLHDAKPLRISQEFTANRVTYSREFSKQSYPGEPGGWETIVLPFDVQRIESENHDVLTPFHTGKEDDKHFWLAGLTERGFGRASVMSANIPYIICMPNSSEYNPDYNISGKVTFSAENVTMYRTQDAETYRGNEYDLVPTYETVSASADVYSINDSETLGHHAGAMFVSDSRDVRPFEAYVVNKDNMAGPRFYLIGNDEMAGVVNVNAASTLPVSAYDLSGARTVSGRKGFVVIRDSKGDYIKTFNK